ncbi:MAG: chromosome partitioning protein ParA [Pseudomonadota bacterium]
MTVEELVKIIPIIGNLGAGAIVGSVISYLLFKNFLPSYFTEKAKNLATKEDIGNITHEVESVKSGYLKVIEELKNVNQLKFAEIEREKSIKKEVYLDAVEALTRTQSTITNLSNLHIDDKTISSQMENNSGVIAKVQIVGSEKTVKYVTTIISAIATAFLELILERIDLVNRKNKIALLEEFRTKAHSEVERCISIMGNLNLEGNSDEHKWDTLKRNIEFQSKTRDDYAKEINSLTKEQNFELLAFSNKCVERSFQITTLLPDVVLAIREELGLTISNEAYVDIFNKHIEEGRQVFSVFFRNASSKLNEQHTLIDTK